MRIFLSAFLFLSGSGLAQNLNNAGSISNTGTIRVRNQATGLPPTLSGKFEYAGGNQTVAPRQYHDLILAGSGIKTVAPGAITVGDSLTIASGITLVTDSGFDLDLDGTLSEQGYLLGGARKTVDLSGPTTVSAFGNLGTTISWTGSPPGTTTVTRRTGVASTGNGNQSVLRYFDIASTFSGGFTGTLVFNYSPAELNGKAPAALELWRSTDNGSAWRRQGGVVDTVQRTVTKSGIVFFSRWTATDTVSLLGPPAYEWVASNLALTSGDNQNAPASSVLVPFVITVSDFYGNPIAGVGVSFAIDSIPAGATGQGISATNATTNALGQASTVLTLGNQPGVYRVAAFSGSLAGSPYRFTATASSAAAAMVLSNGDNQQDTIRATLSPLTVRVNDISGNPVSGVPIRFSLNTVPSGEVGSSLSDTLVTTNAFGTALTTLTLGNKVGTYVVRATTSALPGIQTDFVSTAVAGAAAALVATGGATAQQDTILQVLDSLFVVRIDDSGGNPVPNVSVQFGFTGVPTGATGHGLSVSNGTTNSSGLATTRLTLGSKIGTYQVGATTAALAGVSFTFSAQAVRGAPAILANAGGDGQQNIVATALDTGFVARIIDVGGNPIPGLPVQFTLEAVPTGATGHSLSANVDTTDANGEATTILTLGTKTGLYTVIGTVQVLPGDTARFIVSAKPAPAAQVLAVGGDGQSQRTGGTLAQPFVVTVSDAFGNAVSGVNVLFAITSAPAGATGQQLTPATAITDAQGQAQTTLRLGGFPGPYAATAIVASLPAVQFTATATFIVADVNNDLDVNIADLTSIIDHILQRITLVGVDSIRADVNRDGAINVLDIVTIQNALLGTGTLPKGSVQPQNLAVMAVPPAASTISGELEVTPAGLRFNLTNDKPIKGLQLYVTLKSPATVTRTDVVFQRARSMQFFVNSQGQDMKVVAYNLQNIPVDSGSGSMLRLPLKLADTTQVDSVYAIVSIADTSFDVAVRVSVKKTQSVYPVTFRLYQNYPNPFNAGTNISFDVPDLAGKFPRVLVQVFNLLGEKVKTLAKGEHAAQSAPYVVTWDGTDEEGNKVPSGVYFCRLVSGSYVSAKRMVMVK